MPEYIPLSQSQFMQQGSAITSNLFSGDLAAALGVTFEKPEAMSPEERRKLSDRLGISRGPLASAVDIITNPLVLLGIAGTILFKMPTAVDDMVAAAKSGQVINRFKPLEWVLPHKANFQGTLIPSLLEEVQGKRAGLLFDVQTKLRDAIAATFGKNTISKESQYRIFAELDGTLEGQSQSWARLARTLGYKADTGYVNPEIAARYGYTPGQVQNLIAKMKGISKVELSSAEQGMVKHIRGTFDDLWEKVYSQEENIDEIIDHMAGFDDLEKLDLKESLVGYRDRYAPHIRMLDPEQRAQAQLEMLQSMAPESFKASSLRAARQNLALRQATDRILNRKGGLLPDPEALKALGVDDELTSAIQRVVKQGDAATYTMHLKDAVESYVNDAARTYAWTIKHPDTGKGLGKMIYEEGTKMMARGTKVDEVRIRQLNDTLIPMTLGMLSDSQMGQGLAWGQVKQHTVDMLSKPATRKLIGNRLADNLTNSIKNDPGWSLAGISGGVASFLHSSTLGGNALAASMNLLQTVTTLIPKVGTDVFRGLSDVTRRMPKYVEARTKGRAAFEALAEAFPEFHAAHLELDATARQALQDAMESSYTSAIGVPGVVRKGYNKVSNALMTVFSSTEQFNRLLAFYSARAKGLRELPGHKIPHALLGEIKVPTSGPLRERLASEYASAVVGETQFGSGPLQRPSIMLNVPPPLSQFTTYVGRLLGTAADSALSGNPAMISRMALSSGVAYGIGQELLGQDLSSGLLFGGLPDPQQGVIPPIVGLAGSAWKASFGQGTEDLQRSLPLLVPGGISAARIAGQIPGLQGVAKFTGRSYADYEHRLPDGRVAVYNAQGSLIGYFTDQQLWLKSFGIGNVTQRQELMFTQFLQANRDRMREMKREYLQALYENDATSADHIQASFEKAYPGMGGLRVSQSDIKALHMRRDVSRMERLLQTMPAESRPQFSAMAAVALGSDHEALMGLMENFVGNTAAEREPYRFIKVGDTQQRVSEGLHGVSLRDQIRDQGVQQAYDNRREYAATSPLGDLPSY